MLSIKKFRQSFGGNHVVFYVLGECGLHVVNNAHFLKKANVLKRAGHTRLHELMGFTPVQGHAVENDGTFRWNVHAGEHEMEKEHYIAFVALITGDSIREVKKSAECEHPKSAAYAARPLAA